jgi:hypothetical protein
MFVSVADGDSLGVQVLEKCQCVAPTGPQLVSERTHGRLAIPLAYLDDSCGEGFERNPMEMEVATDPDDLAGLLKRAKPAGKCGSVKAKGGPEFGVVSRAVAVRVKQIGDPPRDLVHRRRSDAQSDARAVSAGRDGWTLAAMEHL